MSETVDLQTVALKARQLGISVIPIPADTTKAPAVSKGEPYQAVAASEDQVITWFSKDGEKRLCLICGAVSGHLGELERAADYMRTDARGRQWPVSLPAEPIK